MKKILTVIGGVVLVVVIATVVAAMSGWVWLKQQLQPVSSAPSQLQFVIPKGQALSIIADRLVEAGVIRHPLAFRYVVWREKLAGKIQAGSFTLNPAESNSSIARQLTVGTEDQWVTILEGWRAEEVAEAFIEFPSVDQAELLELLQANEGSLFPDTYLFPIAADAEYVVKHLTDTFAQKTADLQAQIAGEGKSWEETVVLASIVQREAKTLEQMKMVAGILQNRLEIGQALEVDATLQYIKGKSSRAGGWWSTPLSVDKQLESPFNTYKYPGLPPGAICNPGFDALSATVNPTPSENFFYLHDESGAMYYAQEYDGHLRNIELYLR